jgi:hypothetical protein
MSKRKSLEEWQIQSNAVHDCEFLILETPISGQHNVQILHRKCGKIVSMKLNNHLKRYCAFCSKKSKKTKEEWQSLSDKIHSNEFTIIDDPINSKQSISVLHKKCGSILNMTMNNHINHKNGCKKCSKYSLKTHDYWLSKTFEIYGHDYTILEEVNNVFKKVKIRHNVCGMEHVKNMNSFIHGQRGCPYCLKKDLKYAENFVSKYLQSKSIFFESEKTFDGLVNPKSNRKLRFDFWIPSLNLVIEVNGVQHYKPIECWGGKKSFEQQIYRDEIKKTFLKEKNINLLVINNKQLTKIYELL